MDNAAALKEQAQEAILARGYARAVHDAAVHDLPPEPFRVFLDCLKDQLHDFVSRNDALLARLESWLSDVDHSEWFTVETSHDWSLAVLDLINAIEKLIETRQGLTIRSPLVESYWSDTIQESLSRHAERFDHIYDVLSALHRHLERDEVGPGFWEQVGARINARQRLPRGLGDIPDPDPII